MDFASLMKAQLGGASATPKESGGKTYLKRSDVEAERQAQYLQEQEELETARLDRLEKKRKRDEEEAERNRAREEKRQRLAEQSKRLREEEAEAEERARRKRLGLPELEKKDANQVDGVSKPEEEDISDSELQSKLRDLSEPRILFGETHKQRLRRYRKLTAKALAPKLSNGPIPTTLELLPEAEMKVPDTVPTDPAGHALLLRQLGSYFDMLLSEWTRALSQRSAEVKQSTTGKQASASYAAARDNLRPLFKKLETNTLPPALLTPIHEIVLLAQRKRYVNANDAYLRLSIGKAAWPIGVTMVGIHERSAREKLHETEKTGNQAHILADEATRKMLQGIKRCLSFAQTRWPPEDIGQLMG
jgi:pre-mRNA-splicing factor 18